MIRKNKEEKKKRKKIETIKSNYTLMRVYIGAKDRKIRSSLINLLHTRRDVRIKN